MYDPEYRFNHNKYSLFTRFNSNMTTAMIFAYNEVIPQKYWEHKPEL